MEHVVSLISAYGFWILLPIMIVEGPIITIIASFLASLGTLNIVAVYCFALLGNVIGDLLYYVAGRYGGLPFVEKYGKYIGLKKEAIAYVENHYQNHLFRTLLIAKVTEAFVVPTLATAGIMKADIRKFTLLVTAIEIPKVFLIVCVGYFFGKHYVEIGDYLQKSELALGGLIILLVCVFFAYKKWKPKGI
ncbi:MAG: VTT domain-containing protein [bacterium]